MSSKFYKPNVCMIVQLPKEKEDFINSKEYKLLQKQAGKLDLKFKIQEAGPDNKSKPVLTIGRTLIAVLENVESFEDMVVDHKKNVSAISLATDLPVVEKDIRKFLNSLRGNVSWLAYLYWKEIDILFLKDIIEDTKNFGTK